ncbi:MAG: N-acetylmuramoyl-L-alanine amidase [Smithella sp.]|nr:N-acetylmuramoyl-L-alanine amidase [Smithella sp.]
MLRLWQDAGHGGSDPGATGNGLREKDVNLAIQQKVTARLKGYNVELGQSRTGDATLSLTARTNAANAWQKGTGNHLFLSYHANGFTDPTANGYEDFVHTTPAAASVKAQDAIHRRVAAVFTKHGRRNRGKKRANFHVLRETKFPAVLLEVGFVTNPQDAALLKQDSFLDEVAAAIVQGLVDMYGIKKAATATPAPTPSSGTHTIASGDTFWSLSRRYGVTVDDIRRANPGVDAARLQIGQEVRIPLKDGTPPPKAAPAPKPAPKPKPAPTIRAGSRVKVKQGARDFNGNRLASFVYGMTYSALQISGDRVVIGLSSGQITAAVHRNNLILV